MDFFISLVLSVLLILATTACHYRVTIVLDRLRVASIRSQHRRLFAATLALVATHLVEIGLYALVFAGAANLLSLGTFEGLRSMGPFDYFYFAAETYSSLGYGDIYPSGEMRLIASICPLNGLLLLTWSGAFLVSFAEGIRKPPS